MTFKPVSRPHLHFHLRHIHIPDLPPLYAPKFLPAKLRNFVESQIVQQRQIAEQTPSAGPDADPDAHLRDRESFQAWLGQASPPPTVLSFTRRPTYILPKHILTPQGSSAVNHVAGGLTNQVRITFPAPPGWQSTPWRPLWEVDRDEQELTHNPLDHRWDPTVAAMPCAEPMFIGPGQLSIWPVIDLQNQIRVRRPIHTKYQFERSLEDTTIHTLRRVYGIKAFSIPGSPGVWVHSAFPPYPERPGLDGDPKRTAPQRRANTRRIATIHADLVNNITRFGVSIHVGQPWPAADAAKDVDNPWARLAQAGITTSIAAELAHMDPLPQALRPGRDAIPKHGEKKDWGPRTSQLLTSFSDEVIEGVKAMPYSRVPLRPWLTKPAPLGLDNRGLAAAWAFEFACHLGAHDAVVDHLGVVRHGSGLKSSLTTSDRDVGFISRPVYRGPSPNTSRKQVDVPTILLKEDERVSRQVVENTRRMASRESQVEPGTAEPRALSWPMFYEELTKVLEESVAGNSLDTRLRQFLREKEQAEAKNKETRAREKATSMEQRETKMKTQTMSISVSMPMPQSTVEVQNIVPTIGLEGPQKGTVFNRTTPMRRELSASQPSAAEALPVDGVLTRQAVLMEDGRYRHLPRLLRSWTASTPLGVDVPHMSRQEQRTLAGVSEYPSLKQHGPDQATTSESDVSRRNHAGGCFALILAPHHNVPGEDGELLQNICPD